MNRRDFIKAAMAGAACAVIPESVLAETGQEATENCDVNLEWSTEKVWVTNGISSGHPITIKFGNDEVTIPANKIVAIDLPSSPPKYSPGKSTHQVAGAFMVDRVV